LIVFLDFEASSLGKRGFPIEVGCAAEEGSIYGALIRPAPGWEEWSADAERVHGIAKDRLLREGTPHNEVAAHMVAMLAGHDLFASAPSWDGHWLSLLLRASGLPRHTLRLRGVAEARVTAARAAFAAAGMADHVSEERVDHIIAAAAEAASVTAPAHRALDDAQRELWIWQEVKRRAEAEAQSIAVTRPSLHAASGTRQSRPAADR
jgi:hypothetical protein